MLEPVDPCVCLSCNGDVSQVQNPCCLEEWIVLSDQEAPHDSVHCNCPPISQSAKNKRPSESLPLLTQKSVCPHKMSTATFPECLGFSYREKDGVIVVTRVGLSPKTLFGPLVAPLIIKTDADFSTASSRFFVAENALGYATHFMESDEYCNWMKYVRFVDKKSDANLYAIKLEEHIYFIAFKDIDIGGELVVTYAHNYFATFPKGKAPAAELQDLSSSIEVFGFGNPSSPVSIKVETYVPELPEPPGRVLRPRKSKRVIPEPQPTLPKSDNETEKSSDSDADVHMGAFSSSSDSMSEESDHEPAPRKRRGRPPATKRESDTKPCKKKPAGGKPMKMQTTDIPSDPSSLSVTADAEQNSTPPSDDDLGAIHTAVWTGESVGEPSNCDQVADLGKKPRKLKGSELSKKQLRCIERGFYRRCKYCMEFYASSHARLKKHLEVCPQAPAELPPPEKFKCKFCPEMFTTDEMRKHISTHCIDGNYQCPHCDRKYPEYSKLCRHLGNVKRSKTPAPKPVGESHSSELSTQRKATITYPRPCPVCGKLVNTRTNFKLHKRIHEKPRYVCDFCGKGFIANAERKKHVAAFHTEGSKNLNKPFPCPYCPVRFTSKGNVGQHVKSFHHSDESEPPKPKNFRERREAFEDHIFKCNQCKLGFHLRKSFVEHLDLKHPEISKLSIPVLNLPMKKVQAYCCMVCRRRMVGEEQALNHVRKLHTEEDLRKRMEGKDSARGNTFGKLGENSEIVHDGFLRRYDSEEYCCEVCSRFFSGAREFLAHVYKTHREYHDALMPNAPPDGRYRMSRD